MERQPTLLVVDDEAAILRLIDLHLTMHGMRVSLAHDGHEALGVLAATPIDLVVLDVLMPHLDGFETLRAIRAYSTVPVLMLTASTQDTERVALLAAGADDCLTKPFNPDELTARIEMVLRRTLRPGSASERLAYEALEIDLAQRRVTRHGDEIRLSRTEWELLIVLAHAVGKPLTTKHLLAEVWGREYGEEPQYLHTWVSRLRRKLGDALPLKTLTGIGYVLEPPLKAGAVGEHRLDEYRMLWQ